MPKNDTHAIAVHKKGDLHRDLLVPAGSTEAQVRAAVRRTLAVGERIVNVQPGALGIGYMWFVTIEDAT